MIEAYAFDGKKIIAHEKSWMEIKRDIEWSNIGLYEFIDYTDSANLFNILCQKMAIETKRSFQSRMKRYDRNMNLIQKHLKECFKSKGIGNIGATKGGRLIYFNFKPKLADKAREIYLRMIEFAEKEKIPLMDVSTFGMNSPHIHLVMHPTEGPIIRLSPGSTNYSTVISLVKVIRNSIEKTLKTF